MERDNQSPQNCDQGIPASNILAADNARENIFGIPNPPEETSQLASRREEGLHVVGEVSIRDPEEALAGEDGGEGLRRTLDYRSKEFR
ncbi:MAG: hypothetical protein SEPTF4163_006603 [Sporothrix epigloea]